MQQRRTFCPARAPQCPKSCHHEHQDSGDQEGNLKGVSGIQARPAEESEQGERYRETQDQGHVIDQNGSFQDERPAHLREADAHVHHLLSCGDV
jgi:hypothetical protein